MSKFILPCKEAKVFVKEMKAEGWEAVGMSKSVHIIMRHKNGAKAQVPATPGGDRRNAYAHSKRRLRRIAAQPPRQERGTP